MTFTGNHCIFDMKTNMNKKSTGLHDCFNYCAIIKMKLLTYTGKLCHHWCFFVCVLLHCMLLHCTRNVCIKILHTEVTECFTILEKSNIQLTSTTVSFLWQFLYQVHHAISWLSDCLRSWGWIDPVNIQPSLPLHR